MSDLTSTERHGHGSVAVAEGASSPVVPPAGENTGVPTELENANKVYPRVDVPAVHDVSLHVPAGETVMLLGPSGCGKTTTMKMINRVIEPTSGSILIGGRDVLSIPPTELRRGIGYVIQQIGLFPHMTIYDNVGLVPGMLGWGKRRIAERVDELLTLVGLAPGEFAHRYPRQLSGGQQQRVGVARALAADPPVMLMDEPFGATDPITRKRLQNEFRLIQERLGKTIVFVTHDFDEAVTLGDRIAVLGQQSRIIQYDTPENILTDPADDYVASFIGGSAAIKLLSLLPVTEAELAPGPGGPRTAVVGTDASLQVALDSILAGNLDAVEVRAPDGEPLGHVTLTAIQDRLHHHPQAVAS